MSATVWNAADKHANISLSNADTTAACTTGTEVAVRSTRPKSTGLLYFEVLLSSTANPDLCCIGVADNTVDLSLPLSDATQVAWCLRGNGDLYDNGVAGATLTAFSSDDLIGVALDFTNGYVWFFINGVLANGDTNPPDATNYDFNTLTGTVHAAVGTEPTGPALTGRWQDADLALLPSGFDDWDYDLPTPETLTSDATFSETFDFSGSRYKGWISDSAIAVNAIELRRVLSLASTGAATSTSQERRRLVLSSDAIAQGTVLHTNYSNLTLTSAGVGYNEMNLLWRATATSDAVAQETMLNRRRLTLTSAAVASSAATTLARLKATLTEWGVATDTMTGRRSVRLTSLVEAVSTVVQLYRAVSTLTSDATAVSTFSGAAHIVMALESLALAQSLASGKWTARATLESLAEAESFVRLPGERRNSLWTNTTTAAAVTWEGLPFNSMLEVDGLVYGAGQDGLYLFTPELDDNGEPIDANVTWDLDSMGTAARKRVGHVYVAGRAEEPFTVGIVNHQGSFEYTTRLPGVPHATNHRANTGRGLDSSFYRFAVSNPGYFEVKGVIVDYLETERRI